MSITNIMTNSSFKREIGTCIQGRSAHYAPDTFIYYNLDYRSVANSPSQADKKASADMLAVKDRNIAALMTQLEGKNKANSKV